MPIFNIVIPCVSILNEISSVMKAKKLMILVFSVIAVFSFSSCNDNDRRNEDEQMRNDSIRMAEENQIGRAHV